MYNWQACFDSVTHIVDARVAVRVAACEDGDGLVVGAWGGCKKGGVSVIRGSLVLFDMCRSVE